MPKEIRQGSTVVMRGFKQTIVSDVVEATFTYKADGKGAKSRYDVFMFLAQVDRDELKGFDPNTLLESLGWKFVGLSENG